MRQVRDAGEAMAHHVMRGQPRMKNVETDLCSFRLPFELHRIEIPHCGGTSPGSVANREQASPYEKTLSDSKECQAGKGDRNE